MAGDTDRPILKTSGSFYMPLPNIPGTFYKRKWTSRISKLYLNRLIINERTNELKMHKPSGMKFLE